MLCSAVTTFKFAFLILTNELVIAMVYCGLPYMDTTFESLSRLERHGLLKKFKAICELYFLVP